MKLNKYIGAILGVLLFCALIVAPVCAEDNTWSNTITQADSTMSSAVGIAMLAGLVLAGLMIVLIVRNGTFDGKMIVKILVTIGAVFIVGFIVIALSGAISAESQNVITGGVGVTITTDKSLAVYGDTVHITPTMKSIEPVTYKWQVNTNGTWTDTAGLITGLTVTYSSSVVLYDSHSHTFQYRMIVDTEDKQYISNTVIVKVNPPMPTITATVAPVTSHLYQFNTTSTWTLRYQWQVQDNGTWINLQGENAQSMLVQYANSSAGYKYYYRCSATNDAGTTQSNAVEITLPKPLLEILADMTEVEYDDEVEFTTNATLIDTYQWQVSTDGTTWNDIPNEQFDTFKVLYNNETIIQNGSNYLFYYRCLGTGDWGNVTSNVIQVNVSSYLPSAHITSTQESIKKYNLDATTNFTKAIQWQVEYEGVWINIEGETAERMVIEFTNKSAGYTYAYRCHVTNDAGQNVSNTISLSLPKPLLEILADYHDRTYDQTVHLTSTSSEITSFQWQVSTDNSTWNNIGTASTYTVTYNNSTIVQNGSDYTFYYRCLGAGNWGAVASNVERVNVTALSPSVTITSQQMAINAVQFRASAQYATSLQWQYKDDPLYGHAGLNWEDIEGATGTVLDVVYSKEQEGERYLYRCVASNDVGDFTTSNNIPVVVYIPAPTISISVAPLSIKTGGSVTGTILSATNMSYFQWQTSTDNETWVNYGGQLTTFTQTITLTENGTNYVRCLAVGFGGTTASQVFEVEVNDIMLYTMYIGTGSSYTNPASITYGNEASGMTKAERTALLQQHCRHAVVNYVDGQPQVVYWLYKDNLNYRATDSTCTISSGIASDLTGGDGDVMLLYDPVWWTVTKSNNVMNITFSWSGKFSDDAVTPHLYGTSSADATMMSYVGLGVFEGTVSNNQLRSVNVASNPQVSQTEEQFHTLAITNRDNRYNNILPMTLAWYDITLMFESGSRNTQASFGNGFVSMSSASAVNTGWSASSAWDSATVYTDGKHGVTACGVQNGWGNVWIFLGETTKSNTNIKFSVLGGGDHYNIQSGYNGAPASWRTVSGLATTNNYVFDMGGDSCMPFLPTTVGASATKGWADYLYTNTNENCCAIVGGRWYSGAAAGAFDVDVYDGASISDSSVGARLQVMIP